MISAPASHSPPPNCRCRPREFSVRPEPVASAADAAGGPVPGPPSFALGCEAIASGYSLRNANLMSTVQEIEDAIRQLPDNDLAALRAWFAEFDAAAWDRQFDRDVAEGRLDALADEALRDAREGRCTDL
jgi:hypothetical protein